MNTLIVTGLLALAGFGGFAAADCTDLAGQGYICQEVDENGADIDIYVEPSLPATDAADCTDLAGQGYICAEADENGVDVEVFIEPNPPVEAAQDCVSEEGLTVCADESGAAFEVDREDLGLYASGSIGIS